MAVFQAIVHYQPDLYSDISACRELKLWNKLRLSMTPRFDPWWTRRPTYHYLRVLEMTTPEQLTNLLRDDHCGKRLTLVYNTFTFGATGKERACRTLRDLGFRRLLSVRVTELVIAFVPLICSKRMLPEHLSDIIFMCICAFFIVGCTTGKSTSWLARCSCHR